MSRKRGGEILNRFGKQEILVIGDIMLDRYIWGTVNRISPEAPVPIVKVKRETVLLGGSGNVASNIVSLNGRISCFGVIGSDKAGREVLERLKMLKVNTEGVIKDFKRKTTVKTRLIAHNQQVVRIDEEVDQLISKATEKKIVQQIKKRLAKASCLIISDYDKGVITKTLLRSILPLARKKGLPIAIDPKLTHFNYYQPSTIITPNLTEASKATAIEFKKQEDVLRAGQRILSQNQCEGVLITMGECGMLLFQKGKKPHVIPAVAREVYDVTGAGDTVISTLALAIASGATLEEASLLANHAGGVVVGKLGTAALTQSEIFQSLKY
jgi:D-beta-D-heptose 7-phosphate kinase/D-beta-D-heptose 1-phosphate adenosyltransferase